MLLIIGALLLSMVAVGGVLLVKGVRGRKIDSRPMCRGCGYDLGDLPSANRCPECGADISSWSALRIGRREPRRGIIVASAALLTIGVVPLSLLTIDAARHGLQSRTLTPTWWLLREARSANETTVDAAMDELLSRQGAGWLPNATIADLARQGLAYRNTGSPCGAWHRQYGSFLDAACASGSLSATAASDYALRGVGLFWTTESLSDTSRNVVMITFWCDPYLGPNCAVDYQLELEVNTYKYDTVRVGPFPQRATYRGYFERGDKSALFRCRVHLLNRLTGEPVGELWESEVPIPLRPDQHGGIGYGGRPAYAPIR